MVGTIKAKKRDGGLIFIIVLFLIGVLSTITIPAVIGRASQTIAEYTIPNSSGSTTTEPFGITSGPDGALWFVENYPMVNKIGRVTTSGAFTDFTIPTSQSYPEEITTGPDGALWFTESNGAPLSSGEKIGRLSTTGTFTEYQIPNVEPFGITSGPDGALWFTDLEGTIGRITISGSVTLYPIPAGNTGSFPQSITVGPDGALWFTEANGNMVGRITTSGSMTQYAVPTPDSEPGDITTGPDGALWFVEQNIPAKIGRITTTGTFTEYPLPTRNASPWGITSGTDGALWFTEDGNNNIGRITTSGTITEFPIPSATSQPRDIVTGPNGAMWFTEESANKIGTFSPLSAPITPTNLTVPSPTQNPTLTWNPVSGADSYNIYRNGTSIGFSSTTSFTDANAPEGTDIYCVTAVNNAGESGCSNNVNVVVDRTPPVLSTPSWTLNPMTTTQSTTVTVSVSDKLSGVADGEYYLGTTDPGQGNGTAMTYNSGKLSASFFSMAAGIYTVNFRAQDTAGNWSPATTDYLVVYNATQSSADGHSNKIIPVYGTDVLPGLVQARQSDTASIAFTIKYNNGTLDTSSKVHFDYNTGTNCNNPNKASNCHTTTLDSTSIDWMVVSGTNNSVATIQGAATVTIDGVTSSNPFRIVTTDGNLLNPASSDQLQIQIFAPNSNPNSAQPIYYMNEPLSNGNVVVKG